MAKTISQIVREIERLGIVISLDNKNTEISFKGETQKLTPKQVQWLSDNRNRLIDHLAINDGGQIQFKLDDQTMQLHKHWTGAYYTDLRFFRNGDDPLHGVPKPDKVYPPRPRTCYQNTNSWSDEKLKSEFESFTVTDHKDLLSVLLKDLSALEQRVAQRLFLDGQIPMSIKYAQNRQ